MEHVEESADESLGQIMAGLDRVRYGPDKKAATEAGDAEASELRCEDEEEIEPEAEADAIERPR
jgi:hypothetical protein